MPEVSARYAPVRVQKRQALTDYEAKLDEHQANLT